MDRKGQSMTHSNDDDRPLEGAITGEYAPSARDRRKERLRAVQQTAILDAAEVIFVRDGYHAAKMTDIAEQAGFSTGSLYTYFNGKEEIFQTMIAERFGVLYQLLEAELDRAGSFFELIARLATIYAEFMDERRTFMRIIHAAYPVVIIGPSAHAQLGDVALESYQRFAELLERVVARGIAEEVLRDLPPREMASLFLGMMDAANQLWLLQDPPSSFAEKVPMVLDVLLNGVRR
jgi:AcrR family transcriptional regulator